MYSLASSLHTMFIRIHFIAYSLVYPFLTASLTYWVWTTFLQAWHGIFTMGNVQRFAIYVFIISLSYTSLFCCSIIRNLARGPFYLLAYLLEVFLLNSFNLNRFVCWEILSIGKTLRGPKTNSSGSNPYTHRGRFCLDSLHRSHSSQTGTAASNSSNTYLHVFL